MQPNRSQTTAVAEEGQRVLDLIDPATLSDADFMQFSRRYFDHGKNVQYADIVNRLRALESRLHSIEEKLDSNLKEAREFQCALMVKVDNLSTCLVPVLEEFNSRLRLERAMIAKRRRPEPRRRLVPLAPAGQVATTRILQDGTPQSSYYTSQQ
ncbi:hypothetical protein FGB62_1g324 [Gracilaria domingensis]|nr:hypothetical protein FGB62_1g324 [Gracilaria domingensis]